MSILSRASLFRYRLPLLALACVQAFLCSGIFYGWPALYALILEEGGMTHTCTRSSETKTMEENHACQTDKEKLNLVYTVASSVNLLSQLPWGVILDFLGPRVCNLWSTLIVLAGFILLHLSARGAIDGYMMAMCLIGGAGPGAQISLFHLSELFPMKQKSTVLSIVTGAFQLGFIVFMLFQLAHSYLSLRLSDLCLLYCAPLALLVLLGGVFWPDRPCIPPEDTDPITFTSGGITIKVEQGEEEEAKQKREETEEAEEEEEGAKESIAVRGRLLPHDQSESKHDQRAARHGDTITGPSKGDKHKLDTGPSDLEWNQPADQPSPPPSRRNVHSDPRDFETEPIQSSTPVKRPRNQRSEVEDESAPLCATSASTSSGGEQLASSKSDQAGESAESVGSLGVGKGKGKGRVDYGSITILRVSPSRSPAASSGGSPSPYPSSSPASSLHSAHRTLRSLHISHSNPNLPGSASSSGFMKQLLSPSYLFCLLWLSICLFWANFYIGSVYEQIDALTAGDEDQTRHYTQLFTICLPVGILGIGVFGYLNAEFGFSATIGCTSLFGIGYAISALSLPLDSQPFTFLLYSFFRSFLFSVMFAYLASEFGYRHFGLLSGVMLGVAGTMGMAQWEMKRRWVTHETTRKEGPVTSSPFDDVNRMQVYALCATLLFAVYVGCRRRARVTRVRKQIEEHTEFIKEMTRQVEEEEAAAAAADAAADEELDSQHQERMLQS